MKHILRLQLVPVLLLPCMHAMHAWHDTIDIKKQAHAIGEIKKDYQELVKARQQFYAEKLYTTPVTSSNLEKLPEQINNLEVLLSTLENAITSYTENKSSLCSLLSAAQSNYRASLSLMHSLFETTSCDLFSIQTELADLIKTTHSLLETEKERFKKLQTNFETFIKETTKEHANNMTESLHQITDITPQQLHKLLSDLKTCMSVNKTALHQQPVYQQRDNQTCGYHALKNGIFIARGINFGLDQADITQHVTENPYGSDLFIRWQTLIQQERKRKNHADCSSDFLFSDEFPPLIALEKNGNTLADLPIQFSVIQNITPIHDAECSEVVSTIREAAKSYKKAAQDTDIPVHVFIMGTHTQSSTSSNVVAHWFSIVAYKKDGINHYCVSDSLGKDRTNNDRIVTCLYRFFEDALLHNA